MAIAVVAKRGLSQRELMIIVLLIIAGFLVCWFVGQSVNINGFVLVAFVAYLFGLYVFDTKFLVEYFWLLIMSVLNVVGVFVCDQGLYLVELEYSSTYRCALTPIVILYVILFSVIEYSRIGSKRKCDGRLSKLDNLAGYRLMAYIGIALELYLISQVAAHPYFVVGEARLVYAQEYMNDISVSLRTYLPMFIPVVVFAARAGDKKPIFIFTVLLALFYFLEGDKFGAYMFAAYIYVLCFVDLIDENRLRLAFKYLLAFFILLLGIVYVQRVLLYGESLSEVGEYLSQRLAQQGEVWWSIYSQYITNTLPLADIMDEINVLFSGDAKSAMNYGQWKMMSVASGYSAYSQYRIASGNPYTATTTASLFYYFGWLGTLFFYALLPWVYAKLIKSSIEAFGEARIFESPIYVKLISIFGNVLFASDVTYILSLQGFVYLGVLGVLTLNRERKSTNSNERRRRVLSSNRRGTNARTLGESL